MKIIIAFACSLVLLGPMYGQNDLPTEEVEVVKDFEARLIESQKIKLTADIEENEEEQKFEYEVQEKRLNILYPAAEIRALSMGSEPLPSIYSGFVKAGYGMPSAPFFHGGYYSAISDEIDFGITGKYLGANNNDVENQRFSNTRFNAFSTIQSNAGFAIDAQLNVALDRYHFFGYAVDTSFEEDQVKHKLNDYSGKFRFYNPTQTASDIDYWVDLEAYRFSNNFATKENGIQVSLGLTKWLGGKQPLTIDLGTKYVGLTDTLERNLNQFFIKPSFTLSNTQYRLRLGGNLIAAEETFFIYPDIEFSMQLLGQGFAIIAGATGDLQQNSYRNATRINPFMISQISGLANSSFYDFYGGIKGAFEGISYSGKIGYRTVDNLPFFEVVQQDAVHKFDIGYDTTDIVYLEAVFKGRLLPQLELSAAITRNFYSTKIQESAWYLPKLELNAGAIYTTLNRNLSFKADLFVNETVDFIELDFGEQPNFLVDLSLGVEYFFTENIGGYVQLNNLASTKYVRWYGYPSYGANFSAGISTRF